MRRGRSWPRARCFFSRASRPRPTSARRGLRRPAVEVPARVERVFAAGRPASILLYTLAPDKLLGWTSAVPPRRAGLHARRYARPARRSAASPAAATPPTSRSCWRRGPISSSTTARSTAPIVSLADRVSSRPAFPTCSSTAAFGACRRPTRCSASCSTRRRGREPRPRHAERLLARRPARRAGAGREAPARLLRPRSEGPGDRAARLDQRREHRARSARATSPRPRAGACARSRSSRCWPGTPTSIITIDPAFLAPVRARSGLEADAERCATARVYLSPGCRSAGSTSRLGQPPDRPALARALLYPELFPEDLATVVARFLHALLSPRADRRAARRAAGRRSSRPRPNDADRGRARPGRVALGLPLASRCWLSSCWSPSRSAAIRSRPADSVPAVLGQAHRRAARAPAAVETVVFHIRGPRVLAAAADRRRAGRGRRGLSEPVPQSAGLARHPRRLGRARRSARCSASSSRCRWSASRASPSRCGLGGGGGWSTLIGAVGARPRSGAGPGPGRRRHRRAARQRARRC